MSDMPKRIWAVPAFFGNQYLYSGGNWIARVPTEWDHASEYIRVDLHAAELEALRKENERLRSLISGIIEAWDWWQIDTYERDADVIVDAIDEARAALQGETG